MSLTVDAFLDVVMGEIGYKEQSPKSTNYTKPWTKYGEWWDKRRGLSGIYAIAAWCDMFLGWCAYQAGGEEGLKIVGEYAYTPDHARWFARNGRWGNTPTKGALVFFDWGGSKDINKIDHVGVVIGTDSLGRIVTIEGNTSDQVAKRYRYRDCVVGYGYPAYSTVSVKQPTTSTGSPAYPLAAGDWFSQTRNATHPAVRQIQDRLVKHGHKITVDGIYGPKTTEAVKAFQAKAKVAVDGAVGPVTWARLWEAPATKTTTTKTTSTGSPAYPLAAGDWFSSTRNSRHPAVKQIQAQLVKHGYKIAVDGIYGPKTTAAVKSFQTKAKVTADGAVGPITWPLLWTVPTK